MFNTRVLTHLVCAVALLAGATPALAERGDDADRKSKNGHAVFTIDGVEVEVSYGRPKVKEREIWGKLVPHDKVWRTGANESNTVTFGSDVTIDGQKLAAGTYGLFTIPGADSWTFVFNHKTDLWGTNGYDEKQDALRVTATPKVSEHVEELTFAQDGDRVVLHWEKLAVGFTVAAK